MKKYFAISIMILGMIYVFSVYTHAGNTTNSSATGNVTAVVLCEANESSPTVDEAQVAINSDGCVCVENEADLKGADSTIECDAEDEDDDFCTECLSSLQRAGLSIIAANGYSQPPESEDVVQYTLTGNAGPFLTRIGGCFCD